MDHAAHHGGQVPDRRAEQRRWPVPRLGGSPCGRGQFGSTSRGGYRCGRRTCAASATPYHDPDRRAVLDGLDLTHGGAAVRRAGYEASGFVVRQLIELSGAPAARIVATGGGTRVQPWMQAIADATGLPVEVSAVPEGAALGAAFLARMAAGLETSAADAARWASTERVVDPDPVDRPDTDRYARFLERGQT